MKPIVVALLFAGLALAGCTGDSVDSEPSGSKSSEEMPTEVAGIEQPQWSVGDWWTYDASFGEFSLVVSEDNGATWSMDTDSVNLAFFHSAFGEISYLGDIRKSDLAGSQDGSAVQFFSWPLEHEKTWTADWDGVQLDMLAHVADDGTAHVTGSNGDVVVNQFTFDPAIGWFTTMAWGDTETGEEYASIELKASGTNFADELIRIDAEILQSGHLQGAGNFGSETGVYTIEADDADVFLGFSASCETGAFQIGFGPVQNVGVGSVATGDTDGFSHDSTCPADDAVSTVIGTPAAEGEQWGHYVVSESPDFDLQYTLWLRQYERINL